MAAKVTRAGKNFMAGKIQSEVGGGTSIAQMSYFIVAFEFIGATVGLDCRGYVGDICPLMRFLFRENLSIPK